MKRNFLYFLCLWCLISCQGKEKKTEIQQSLRIYSPQVFTINATKDTTLTGEKGTIISIKANSFDLSNTKDKVEIKLEEYYSTADFVTNRLSTKTADGRLLRSSGMVFLQAQAAGVDVKLKENQSLTLQFPRKQTSPTANLFKGVKGINNEIVWTLLPPVHQDTTHIIYDRVDSLDNRGVEYTQLKLKLKIGNDTIEMTEKDGLAFQNILRQVRSAYIGDTVAGGLKESAQLYYIFKTSQMGWINCDIFIEEELFPFVVKTNKAGRDVMVILDSLNSVLYPDSIDSKTNCYTFNLPKNIPISVVSYKEEDEQYLFGMQKTSSSQGQVLMEEKQTSLKNIEKIIKNLH